MNEMLLAAAIQPIDDRGFTWGVIALAGAIVAVTLLLAFLRVCGPAIFSAFWGLFAVPRLPSDTKAKIRRQ